MLDSHIDRRFKRTWDFFLANATGLLLGSLVVLIGSIFIIPGPWFAFNLLQETLESVRTGRPVRWQAAYERQGNFLKSWGLTLIMGIPIALGYSLIVPGLLLSIIWFHAPMLAAEGRTVIGALSESFRVFQRRSDWAAYFLNVLVLVVLSAVAGLAFPIAFLTLPLSFVYLALCHTDEKAQEVLPRREVVV
ncbi:hypothetical protein [Melittangium boletus]|uniref:Transmembrane protein n=1 Tax=Melittangium boletus DSM 14713 TaxID=1294270 RepID=A0A250ISD0_9BACT|nr:hypothetical protein [Melittangium boletus]ATB34168.1 hypothetical protein MEBOL_007669 [Melittangium boletus DSM 14713]